MLPTTGLANAFAAREIADVVAFLCSDWASYVSGVTTGVDGARFPAL